MFIRPLAVLLVAAGLSAHAADGRTPRPVIERAAKGAQCVEPVEAMRRNHMDYLKHERIAAVHNGVRGSKYSIAECVDCHAGRDAAGKPVPVTAEGQFCQKCHNYTAVHIECFQCHRKVPQEK